MKQYNAIKNRYPDAMLLFRVGDFYETFGEDAKKAADVLGITLTKRGAGSETETALAGFPHHSIENYLPKLVKAGHRVAICDQLEDPKLTKTIVKRGVTELITPGLAIIDEVLSPKTNNFLAAISLGKQIGISFLDVSTGEFLISEGTVDEVDKLLQNFNPSEILVSKQKKQDFSSKFSYPYQLFYLEDWVFQHDFAKESICSHFKTKNLKGFGIENLNDGVIAAGAIMHYLSETQHQKINHISSIKRIPKEDYVWMDRFTTRNLELFNSNNLNAVTLIDVIDKTISPMGGRLLKRWLALPLKDLKEINSRQEVVEFFIQDLNCLNQIQHHIKLIGDIERLISKVATFKISPREVIQLKNSLEAIIPIKSLAEKSTNASVKEIGDNLSNCDKLRDRIKETLLEEAPVNILKGKTISSDFSSELKELIELAFSQHP